MLPFFMRDKIIVALFHFFISTIVMLACYLIIAKIWYPSPLFEATHVGKIFLIILTVDLVLGPLITFIVYKKNKKTLLLDLCFVALLQLSALSYGMYSIYEARPVWIAYVIDRFELVQANEIIYDSENPIVLPSFGPEYRYVDISTNDPREQLEIFNAEVTYGIKPTQRPKFYRNFEIAKPLIRKNYVKLEKLKEYNSSERVKNILERYPKSDGFIPLSTNATDMTILIDQKSGGNIVAIVNLRPWIKD